MAATNRGFHPTNLQLQFRNRTLRPDNRRVRDGNEERYFGRNRRDGEASPGGLKGCIEPSQQETRQSRYQKTTTILASKRWSRMIGTSSFRM